MESVLKVGLVGAGEVAQTIVLPNLRLLSHRFKVEAICDISQNAIDHVSSKFNIDKKYRKYQDMLADSDVEAVMVLAADEFHAQIAIDALKARKAVFIEKPMALSVQSADAIIDARNKTNGVVFVGYQRRYAEAFNQAVEIVRGMDKISYARVRDIIGPNNIFVGQSGTYPQKFSDFSPEATEEMRLRSSQIAEEALGNSDTSNKAYGLYRLLGSLGSHDLSAMREILGGIPKRVLGVSNTAPTNDGGFLTALFDYGDFVATYETGVDDVGLFDAHIEVYGGGKRVRVEYDTPYVKGLPIKLVIGESVDGAYVERVVRPSYEDAYTIEYNAFYDAIRHGKPIKTTAEDAKQDLAIFKMLTDAFAQHT